MHSSIVSMSLKELPWVLHSVSKRFFSNQSWIFNIGFGLFFWFFGVFLGGGGVGGDVGRGKGASCGNQCNRKEAFVFPQQIVYMIEMN